MAKVVSYFRTVTIAAGASAASGTTLTLPLGATLLGAYATADAGGTGPVWVQLTLAQTSNPPGSTFLGSGWVRGTGTFSNAEGVAFLGRHETDSNTPYSIYIGMRNDTGSTFVLDANATVLS